MNSINVMLVDDQKLFINSLKTVLELKDSNIKIIATCYDGLTAVSQIENLKVDIILMDVKMPVMDGVEATRKILGKYPEIKIIMLTTFNEDEYVKKALNYGAKGYLLKDMLPEELIFAIKTVYNGIMSISPSIVIQSISNNKANLKPSWFLELNQKELEILRLVSMGYDNHEISQEVNLAKQTVKNYISRIYEIMDVRDRMQAMRTCIDLKLFE